MEWQTIEVLIQKIHLFLKINPKQKNFFTPMSRVSRLRRLLETQKIVRFIECHNPLVGL